MPKREAQRLLPASVAAMTRDQPQLIAQVVHDSFSTETVTFLLPSIVT
jgi:hypothetical protein